MGLLTFVGRIVLVVINIVFILFALALIIAGFIIRFAHDTLRPQMETVLKKIENVVQNAYEDANFSTDDFEFGSLVGTLCYILIAAGVVLLAISFVGCCGACCNFTTLMLVYAIVLIVLLVVQVASVIIIFAAPDLAKNYMKKSLKETMKDYDGIKGTTVSALGWNWIQQEYECCGAENYLDFENKGSPYKTGTTYDNAAMGGGATGDVVAPVACCKTLPTNDADRQNCAGNAGSPPTDSESNLNKGCVDEIWHVVVKENTEYFLIGVGFIAAFQIVLIVFACLGYKNRGITGGLV